MRTCHYCGKSSCSCRYRYGRKSSGSAHEMQNTSSQSTVGEMQEQFAEYFAKMDPTKPAVWKISVTGIDPCKKGS